jgi:glycosyltransferase involved in cell wall biosynthesis
MHVNIVCPQSFGSLFYLGTLMKQLLNGARVTLSNKYIQNAHNILIDEGVTSVVYKRKADIWWTDTPAMIYRDKNELARILKENNLFRKHYTVSEFCKQIYRDQGIPVEDTVIPRPVNPILFNYRTDYDNCRYDLCFIGAMDGIDRKNLRLIEPVVIKHSINTVLITNGFFPKRPFITQYSFGSVTDEEKAMILSSSRFLVFPSFIEGFGMPPLEAMSVGCIPIYSDVPAHNEFCIGIPVKPRDKYVTFGYGCRIVKYVIDVKDLEEAVKYALGMKKEEYIDLQSKCIERAKYMFSIFKSRLKYLLNGGDNSG